uniref:Uncharacterized protein n=1 Tax=Strongyloides stercoralis TaxID=6248 RepID=A0A0K0EPL0_STRER
MTFCHPTERTHNHHDGKIHRMHGTEYNHFRGPAQECYECNIEEKSHKDIDYSNGTKYLTFHFNDNRYKNATKWFYNSEPDINLLFKTEKEDDKKINDSDKKVCSNNFKKAMKKRFFKIISEPEFSPNCLKYLDRKKK